MTNENKNKWSVIINIALTTITAILSALGFTVGYFPHTPTKPPHPHRCRGFFHAPMQNR